MAVSFALEPNPIYISDELLSDLRNRLKNTRWPLDNGNDNWFYGVSRNYLEELVDYWMNQFDWRKSESAIYAYEHYKVNVEGVPVHFMRKPGKGPNPIPLILSHGWPWTFWHWSKVIDPLADPGAFGGNPAEAFDVIVPSLPGYGFSSPLPSNPDLNYWKIADLWNILMTDILGYDRYAAGGCDVGALITGQLGHKYSDNLYAIHIGSALKLNFFNGDDAWNFARGRILPDNISQEKKENILELDRRFASHLAVHVLDPSTLAFGLSDSPVGMLAWILERWIKWSNNNGNVENVFSKDDLLTHATIFWVNNTIETSIRVYANNNRYPWTPSHNRWPVIEAPTGITFVGYENPPGITTENRIKDFLDSDRAPWYNHVNITAHEDGGHFIPWEIPDKWVEDLRRTFRGLR